MKLQVKSLQLCEPIQIYIFKEHPRVTFSVKYFRKLSNLKSLAILLIGPL